MRVVIVLVGLFFLWISSVTADITGTITDHSSPTHSILGVAAFEQWRVSDPLFPLLLTVDAAVLADSLPPHGFTIPADPAKTYVLAAIGFVESGDDISPEAIADIRYNVAGNASGVALAITPNPNHITGRLYSGGGGSLGRDPMIWVQDTSGKFVTVGSPDTAGNFSLNYLPGAGPYTLLSVAERHYVRVDANKVNPSTVGLLGLSPAGQTLITGSANTGVPGQVRAVLSDRKNFELQFTVFNAPFGQALTAVTIEAPGGDPGDPPVRYYLSPVASNHRLPLDLFWTSIVVETNRQPNRITFARGVGTSKIPPGASATFTLRIDSTTNVDRDTYQDWNVVVRGDTADLGRAQEPDTCSGWEEDCGLETVQRILEPYDLRFDPPSNNDGTEPVDVDRTLRLWVRNCGTGVFHPYPLWTSVDPGGAFSYQQWPPTVVPSLAPGDSVAVLSQSVHTTMYPGTFTLHAFVIDSTGPGVNTSYADYRESLRTCFMRGDVTVDGVIDLSDLVALVQDIVFGVPLPNPTAGDANCDGVRDIVDLALLVQFVVFFSQTPCCL